MTLFHIPRKKHDPKAFEPCWILTHTRTGSTYLCYLLNNTKLFGNRQRSNPLDGYFFNTWGEYFHANVYAGIDEFVKNPPLKAKVHRHHFTRYFKDTDQEWIESLLPGLKYVLLRRKDVVAHTVSRYFSRETKTHHCSSEEKLKTYQETVLPLNYQRLLFMYKQTRTCYVEWNNFLKNRNFLDLEYEDVISKPKETVLKVLDFLGMAYRPENINLEVPLHKLEHPQKQEFIQILTDLTR